MARTWPVLGVGPPLLHKPSRRKTHSIPQVVRAKIQSLRPRHYRRNFSFFMRSQGSCWPCTWPFAGLEEVVTGLLFTKCHVLILFTSQSPKNHQKSDTDRQSAHCNFFQVSRLPCTQLHTSTHLSCSLPIDSRYWSPGKAPSSRLGIFTFGLLIKIYCLGVSGHKSRFLIACRHLSGSQVVAARTEALGRNKSWS